MAYTISAPPHKKERITFSSMNWSKIVALVPVSLIAIYFFGIPALEIILAAVIAAVLTEYGIQMIFKQNVTVKDGHAAMIGLMFALLTPPEAPIWLPVVGGFFAIAIGKHAFGGIGSYIFNPVLVSWVFVRSAWSGFMTPASIPHIGPVSDILLESGAGLLVGVSPIALIGGVYLIYKRYVEWRVPLTFFLTVFFFNQAIAFVTEIVQLVQEGVLNPLLYLATMFTFLELTEELSYAMIGVVIFGILFLSTDSPTTPITKAGRLIYGVGCGVLVSIYGYFGNYVDGTLYGIFLANGIASFLESRTIPGSFGQESLLERSYKRVVARLPPGLRSEVVSDD
ncbi:Rnf electron transport complex subunit RnfD [Methanolobus halotolerans]|uniref:NADH:ubiquinone oxidoreductase n=1 Tax=Methanolobus halotolerans TaxID=2052935 RepID=A0A4E0Q6C9_9EURY|nr:Rnf electron transport complex subunit RnfD [Methanolobus halotolerans]TGC09663.1 NADH:ubiquinone oxidoreductase [Methanolobus halotolerans]